MTPHQGGDSHAREDNDEDDDGEAFNQGNNTSPHKGQVTSKAVSNHGENQVSSTSKEVDLKRRS